MIHPELLEILCCPETRQPVREAGDEVVQELNRAIRAGTLNNASGNRVMEEITGGLIRSDGKVLYPVRDDIPIMLIDEALALAGDSEESEEEAGPDRDGGHHEVEPGSGA